MTSRSSFLPIAFVGLTLLSAAATQADAFFPEETSWKLLKGWAEASTPDATAWRSLGFDDSAWAVAEAPFFYELGSGYSGATELADMSGNYSCIYLRKNFRISTANVPTELTLDVRSDDGCIVWINGAEVLRVNVSAGEVPFNGTASGSQGEPNTAGIVVPDAGTFLVSGDNVIAIQAFNASLTGSSDFLIAAALGSNQDVTAPTLANTFPRDGAVVRAVSSVEVAFSEDVEGVDAADLLANGQHATGLEVYSARNYAFSFPEITGGEVVFSWALEHGIADLAPVPNPFSPLSWSVTVDPSAPEDSLMVQQIGNDPFVGELLPVAGGYDIRAAGTGFVGNSDSGLFASKAYTGDFDLCVRVAGLAPGDIWAQGGLMARESDAGNAPFAAVFATPSNVGVGFVSRQVQSSRQPSVPAGLFPANYPNTWLRLSRVGDRFTGYAALDGVHWRRLGEVDITLGTTIQVGLMVASHRTGEPVDVHFRDWGDVESARELTTALDFEVPGQASRLTPFVVTEIMYHPTGVEGSALEFVEIFNAIGTPEDLSGYRLSGDISYTFPDGVVLGPGHYLVVAKDPVVLAAQAGITNVVGPFSGSLSDNGGVVRLRHRTGAVFLEVDYGTGGEWPRAADGTGHSLVLARPSLGENQPAAWRISDVVGGSPGRADSQGIEPLRALCINEFLAHTDDPLLDYIELYNASDEAIDISGCLLSDRRSGLVEVGSTNVFRIPDGTVLGPYGWIVFDQSELGFALDAAGETLYLMDALRTRVLDAVQFAGQANGVASGRYPDGAARIRAMAQRTPGGANSAFQLPTVVINELLYNPISRSSDDEFVELHNRSGAAVDVSGWRFTRGIDYEMPAGTSIPGGGYLVVAANRTNLLSRYPGVLNSANTVGDYGGALDNSGETLVLSMPEELVSTNQAQVVVTNTAWITLDEVAYRDGGRWSAWADAGGSSLERVDPRSDGHLAANWAASAEGSKALWTTVDYTNRVELGETSPNQLQVLLLGAGECLLDDVEVLDANGNNLIANPGFTNDAAGWTAEGTLSGSVYQSAGGVGRGGCYRIVAVDRGDNQMNRIRVPLTTPLSVGSVAVIRAKVRWLRGYPEVLFRIRGRWVETLAELETPGNPGTPGQVNGQQGANGPPAIFDVSHFPVVPAAGEPVYVTACAADPDGIGELRLKYRVDPGGTLQTVVMSDDGLGGDAVAGDGRYTAILPAQAGGVLVAFHVEADDASIPPLWASYPDNAPARECLVRWGDEVRPGSIPAYRIWMTQATFDTWTSRNKLDNTPNDATFVYGNQRAIYNTLAQYAGSPYISPGYNTPAGNRCGYSIELPWDDIFLGGTDLVLDWPGGHGNERTAVQEQMAYWIADRMGLPFSFRHFIRLSVNGVTDMQRGGVFEAIIQPARDFVRAWSPGDSDGDFYKIDRAFEFSDTGSRIADPMPTLEVFNGADGEKKKARYRWNWLRRSYDSADSFTNLFEWVDAMNAPDPEPYTSMISTTMDVEECMGMFAFEHIIVNFDSWGHNIGKNMYAYKPETDGWQLYAFDLDWLMLVAAGASGNYSPSTASLFSSQDPTVARLYAYPAFRRAYFRAVQKALDEAFVASDYTPVMEAKYGWLVDEGVTMCDGGALIAPTAVADWFATRRTFLEAQLNSENTGFLVNGPPVVVTTNNPVVFTGTAPMAVAGLAVNGVTRAPVWLTSTAWSMEVPLTGEGTNVMVFEGLDADGRLVEGATDSVTVIYEGPASPIWGLMVRLNEWMADNQSTLVDPVDGQAEDWFELYNSGQGVADLSGFYLTDDLAQWSRWQIPEGTLLTPGGYLLVWADGEPEQGGLSGSDLHAGFSLSRSGETLGLFAPDGTLVDTVSFGPQAEDVSEGRFADAADTIGFMTAATPRGANAPLYGTSDNGPYMEPLVFVVTPDSVQMGWVAKPGWTYQVEYSVDLNNPVWLPLGTAQVAVEPVIRIEPPLPAEGRIYFRIVETP